MGPVSLLESAFKYIQVKPTDKHPVAVIKSLVDTASKEKSKQTYSTLFSESDNTELLGKLKKAFWSTMGVWASYNLVDSGLARFLALETLIHGTGPLGYLGISLYGADPNFGGGNTGSSVAIGENFHAINSSNYFHTFKDSAIQVSCENFICRPLICRSLSSVLARMHAMGSGMSNYGYSTTEGLSKIVRGVLGGISGFLTPTLKFRFKPEEVLGCTDSCRFENDPDYAGMAYRTTQAISPTHLGITGSLTQGIDFKMFSRMLNNPGKVLLGAVLLGTSVMVARATYRYIKAKPIKKDMSMPDIENSRRLYGNQKARIIAVRGCWVAAVAAAVFLNTL